VITDAALPSNCFLTVRLLGVIEAEERPNQKQEANRNDRLIGVPSGDPAAASLASIHDLRPEFLDQIERFFKSYGEFKGKEWRTVGRRGADRALELLEEAMEARRRKK
jgi:inorganic pyrophosphatase